MPYQYHNIFFLVCFLYSIFFSIILIKRINSIIEEKNEKSTKVKLIFVLISYDPQFCTKVRICRLSIIDVCVRKRECMEFQ